MPVNSRARAVCVDSLLRLVGDSSRYFKKSLSSQSASGCTMMMR